MKKPFLIVVALLVIAWAVLTSVVVVGVSAFTHWGLQTPGVYFTTVAFDVCMPLGGLYAGVIFTACLLYWWATSRADKAR